MEESQSVRSLCIFKYVSMSFKKKKVFDTQNEKGPQIPNIELQLSSKTLATTPA